MIDPAMAAGALPPIVVATRNVGKLRELRPMIEAAGWRAETLSDVGLPETAQEDALEVYATFEENALAKARWFASLLPGRHVLADDSGLEVDALLGAPGVHSKRWSNRPELTGASLDEANNALLLDSLDVRKGDRTARYVCAAAACVWRGQADVWESVVRGETRGAILHEPRGAGGFGYDPFFLSDELGMTFAEASSEAKWRVGHRGRAFAGLLRILRRPVDPAERGG